MELQCQHCGERIVARGFGKCPGCYRELPPELQLSASEQEIAKIDEKKELDPTELLGDGSWTVNGVNPPV